MQPDQNLPSSVEVPAYVPDDILERYVEEARQQVHDAWLDRPPTAAVGVVADTAPPAQEVPARGPLAGWSAKDREFAVLACKIGLVGWALLVALWSWLAWSTGSGVWTAFAAVGWITFGPGFAVLAHLSGSRVRWSRRQDDQASDHPEV